MPASYICESRGGEREIENFICLNARWKKAAVVKSRFLALIQNMRIKKSHSDARILCAFATSRSVWALKGWIGPMNGRYVCELGGGGSFWGYKQVHS
jgi:hypothetical protein